MTAKYLLEQLEGLRAVMRPEAWDRLPVTDLMFDEATGVRLEVPEIGPGGVAPSWPCLVIEFP